MNIKNLVTQYVAFRRALGELCKTSEIHQRAFCRAIGPRTPIKRIRLKDVEAFLAGTGPLHMVQQRIELASRAQGAVHDRAAPLLAQAGSS